MCRYFLNEDQQDPKFCRWGTAMEGWKGQEANAERGLAGAGVFKHDRTNIYSHELSSFVPRNNPMTFSTATI